MTRSSDEDDLPQSQESGSDVGAIAFEPKVIEISDSEDEKKSSPRRPVTTRHLRRRRAKSDGDDDSTVSDSLSEENIVSPIVWKGKGKAGPGKRKQVIAASESEEDVRPKKRKLVRGERPPTPEEDDLMEELDEDSQYSVYIVDCRLPVAYRDFGHAFTNS